MHFSAVNKVKQSRQSELVTGIRCHWAGSKTQTQGTFCTTHGWLHLFFLTRELSSTNMTVPVLRWVWSAWLQRFKEHDNKHTCTGIFLLLQGFVLFFSYTLSEYFLRKSAKSRSQVSFTCIVQYLKSQILPQQYNILYLLTLNLNKENSYSEKIFQIDTDMWHH